MALKVQLTKNGKPNILYKNRKYRESHSLMNGEKIWRCLGQRCNARIKTDVETTAIIVTSGRHTGPHTVTMRNILSPQQNSSLSVAAAVDNQLPTLPPTPTPQHVAPHVADTPTTPGPSLPPTCSPPNTSLSLTVLDVPALVAENSTLKEKLLQLDKDLHCILDQSIVNDSRLLQFTRNVFVPNQSQVETSSHVTTTDSAVQCEISTAYNNELVTSLKTTIETLEAEVNCLRNEAASCICNIKDSWTVIESKKALPLQTKNRFIKLADKEKEEIKTVKLQEFTKATIKQRKRKPRTSGPRNLKVGRATTEKREKKKISLKFESVDIEGDSHCRHLASLVQQRIESGTAVQGNCKPGAKLLTATSSTPPPPNTCRVIIAGTNDVAAGQQRNIYRHIEGRIKTALRTANVVVATLPHRHDLPDQHPVNVETALANSFIEEVCARHTGAELLDFNTIQRRHFTTHGMHLKLKSKPLLTDLLLRCLARLSSTTATTPELPLLPERPATSTSETRQPQRPTRPPPAPRTLPHNTFADAVKMSQSKNMQTVPALIII